MSEAGTRGTRKTLIGIVRKVSSAKTISVVVSRRVRHPKYGKYVTRSQRMLVHDETSEARPGDRVEIASIRPISARKFWRVVRVASKGVGEPGAETVA